MDLVKIGVIGWDGGTSKIIEGEMGCTCAEEVPHVWEERLSIGGIKRGEWGKLFFEE